MGFEHENWENRRTLDLVYVAGEIGPGESREAQIGALLRTAVLAMELCRRGSSRVWERREPHAHDEKQHRHQEPEERPRSASQN